MKRVADDPLKRYGFNAGLSRQGRMNVEASFPKHVGKYNSVLKELADIAVHEQQSW